MEQTKVGHDRKVAVQRVVAEDMFPEYQDQKTTMVSRDQRYVAVHNGATIEHSESESDSPVCTISQSGCVLHRAW